VNTFADALVILARAALALILALGLVALAIYAAADRLGQISRRT
jgi:NAD/NADP transhydrogenase alpha subunit